MNQMQKVIVKANVLVRTENEVVVYVPDDWSEKRVKEEFHAVNESVQDMESFILQLGMLGVHCNQVDIGSAGNNFGVLRMTEFDINIKDCYITAPDAMCEIFLEECIKREDIAVGNQYRMSFWKKEIELKIINIEDEMIYASNQKGEVIKFSFEEFIMFHYLYGW